MSKSGPISIIVSTYNRPAALAAVLDSLTCQDDPGFEVVVADDGSGPETGTLLAERAKTFPVPLSHVWQEDRGFRAAAARNRAVAASRGDYLVFLDGDCLVRPDFVAIHRRLAEAGCFVAGNRMLLGPELTDQVLAGLVFPAAWGAWSFVKARLRGRINRLLPLLHLPDGRFRHRRGRHWQGAMTCNLAVWRDDFFLVNGFDEAYTGWGHEDAEFVVRLLNSGICRKEGRFGLPVLHLWHSPQDRRSESENLRRLQEHLDRRLTRAELGVDRYRSGPESAGNQGD